VVGSRPSTDTVPVLGWPKPLEDLDQRRLAGTVRAQQPDHPTGADLDIDSTERQGIAVAFL